MAGPHKWQIIKDQILRILKKAGWGIQKGDDTDLFVEAIARQIAAAASSADSSLVDHILDRMNPHGVTAEQVGLGNVLNVEQIPASEKGQPGGVAELDENGLILSSRLPDLAKISVWEVASEAEQLALPAQSGDVAVRTDQQRTYMHNGGVTGTMSDWTELKFPASREIGVPADGSWTDGFFDSWTPTTQIPDALDDISEAFSDLAPPKPGVLTGKSLTLSGTTLYQAKLPSGLSAAWYSGGEQPGDTIGAYVTDGVFTLSSPDPSTSFRCGRKDKPSTYGVISRLDGGVVTETYDLGTLGVGSSGSITVTALDVYNNFWMKANARLSVSLSAEGRSAVAMEHTEAGRTDDTVVWYDPSPGAPAFSSGPTAVTDTLVPKYLSGVVYYGLNSVIRVSYTAASGIFDRCYHPSKVSEIICTGAPNTVVNPAAVPDRLDEFAVVDRAVTLTLANRASLSKTLSVTLRKPTGASATATAATEYAFCTYGVVSTDTVEYFYDEARRLVPDTDTAWDSTAPLQNGDAQVVPGSLVYGDGDYPGKTGPQEWQRKFKKVSASNGSVTLSGVSVSSAVAPYGTGDLNVLIRLDSDGRWIDLGRMYGDDNGDGSGTTRDNSVGGRISASGSTIDFTLGLYSTANNNHEYRLVVILRSPSVSVGQITTA